MQYGTVTLQHEASCIPQACASRHTKDRKLCGLASKGQFNRRLRKNGTILQGEKAMKVLCTGGAGFLGSNLVQTLVQRGDQVTVLDDFSAGKLSNLESVIDRVNVVRGSVTDLELLRKLTSETDIIFHLAVQCLMVCNENPILAHEVNDKGTFNVCQAAKEKNNKLIYISSSEIYGTSQYSPMDEKHPTNPQSIYGLTKLVGEQYVQLFNKIYGVPAVIIRPFNAYGPNHREDNYAAVITAFIKRLEHEDPP